MTIGTRFLASSGSSSSSSASSPFTNINLNSAYNPSSGTPTQLNVGTGPVIVGSNGSILSTPSTTPSKTYQPPATYKPTYVTLRDAYGKPYTVEKSTIDPKTGQQYRRASFSNANTGQHISSNSNNQPRTANDRFLLSLLSKSGSGPLNYTDKKTLLNIQDRIAFNSSIKDLLGWDK